jgi:hypothetical protein
MMIECDYASHCVTHISSKQEWASTVWNWGMTGCEGGQCIAVSIKLCATARARSVPELKLARAWDMSMLAGVAARRQVGQAAPSGVYLFPALHDSILRAPTAVNSPSHQVYEGHNCEEVQPETAVPRV